MASYGYKSNLDMKGMIAQAAYRLVSGANAAMADETIVGLRAWGAGIRSFESMLTPFVITDEGYKTKRDAILLKLEPFKGHVPNSARNDYFDLYNEWLALLCMKVNDIGIYPRPPGEEDEDQPEYVNDEDE